jgi:peptidoglycan/xylan/chitin deacetylase (PgdA/CDA1 family)
MLQGATRLGAMGARASRVRHGVPVLMYHLVSEDVPPAFRSYTVTPDTFASQIRWLRRLGYESVTPADLWAARSQGRRLPPRPVAITFDDGFLDCLRHAAPVLHDAGFRATMYVVAGLLGGTSGWMAAQGLDHLRLVSAAEARELEQAGVECQSHALTHPRLAELSTPDIARELSVSREVLEDELGHEVRHLAYPHGSYDERVREEARAAGYLTACTTQPGKVLPRDDRLTLSRVKVEGDERTADFLARLATGRHLGHPVRPQPSSRRA